MPARRWPFVLVLVLVLAAAAASAWPQSQPASQQPPAPGAAVTVGVSASRVAVDVVVRDKRGRLVRDLEPGEIELLEDGARQEVLSLRLVDAVALEQGPAVATPMLVPGAAPPRTAPAAPRGPAPTPAPAQSSVDEQPLLVAFLFDRLSPQARRIAYDAALDWLRRPAPARRLVGVFRIDQKLDTLLAFSSDRQAIEQALAVVLQSQPSLYGSESDRDRLRDLRQQANRAADAVREPAPGEADEAGGLGEGTAAGATAGVQAQGQALAAYYTARTARTMELMRLRTSMAMLEAQEALERDQQGLTTVNSMLALVNGLKTAPGRKAVVFFSEGLVVPPRVAPTLVSLIAEANRGGVTFYTADAAGLRTASSTAESRKELQAMAKEIEAQQYVNDRSPDSAARAGGTRMMTTVLEHNEDMLRSDPHGSLESLARKTGGFLISDTNEVGSGLQAAADDLAAYYLVEYAPANELWDGRFRHIQVKVKRPGVRVQARQGYFAVKTAMPTPLLDFEAPVLAALELAPRARDFSFRAAAVRMPDQPDESAVAVLVEVPGDSPSLDRDEKEKRYRQEFTVLVLVRDETGRVVRKLSRRYANGGPLEKADELRRSRMLVLRESWLPPGRYTVEAAVQDAATGRLGVERLGLDVPDESTSGLRVGSVVVVGHAAPHQDAPAEAPSLLSDGVQIYPGTGPFSRAAGRPIAFFLAAQQQRGRQVARALVELLRRDGPVFQANAEFKPSIGRATLMGGVPLDGVEPGDYLLRVTVEDGVERAVRSAAVTVTP